MAELEAVLTANIRKLESQLAKAEREVSDYGRSVERTNKRVDSSFNKSATNLNRENQRLSKGFRGTSAGAVEFGRLLGDLPFGIQGVANNIQQLAFVMGGGAALQIGLAGVTALMLVLEKRGFSLGSIFSDLSKTTREYAKASKEIVGPVRAEIAELETLVKIAEDTAIATSARQRAIDRLNDKYGDYLGNLDLESIKTKSVRDEINRLTDSLLKNAQARASQDLIQSIFNDRQEKLITLTQRQKNAANAVAAEVKRLTDNVSAFASVDTAKPLTEQIKQIEQIVNSYGGQGAALVRVLDNNVKEYNKAVADTRQYSKETKQALEPVLNLFEQLTVKDLLSQLDEVQKEVVVTAKKIGESAPQYNIGIQKNPFANFISPDLLAGQGKIALQRLSEVLEKDGPTLIAPGLSNIEQKYADFRDRVNSITIDLASAVSSGFSVIGQSLANGADLFGAVGQAILQTMGSIAVELGKASIAAGIAGLALKNLFKSPFAAIAAGGALVAIGSALSSARGAVSGIGGGGSIGGQGSTSFSGSSGSTSFSNGGFNGRVVFEISGNKLIGVMNNTLSANQRLGGNISLG